MLMDFSKLIRPIIFFFLVGNLFYNFETIFQKITISEITFPITITYTNIPFIGLKMKKYWGAPTVLI